MPAARLGDDLGKVEDLDRLRQRLEEQGEPIRAAVRYHRPMRIERNVLEADHRAGVGRIAIQQEGALPDAEGIGVVRRAPHMDDDGIQRTDFRRDLDVRKDGRRGRLGRRAHRCLHDTPERKDGKARPISPLTPPPCQSVIAGMESGSEDQPRLTGAERGKLRSLAQTLDPKVFVGKAGVNAGIANLLEEAFRNADLVKVRFTAEREEMDKQAQELAKLTESEVIGSVGRTATFFKLGADAE
ncbi:MAG: YhbY family RNA-binding protein [Verrucomicrobia bacterium]|nr:YhbY family RNA-binding protein [Verrucomicrobiota bacterium]